MSRGCSSVSAESPAPSLSKSMFIAAPRDCRGFDGNPATLVRADDYGLLSEARLPLLLAMLPVLRLAARSIPLTRPSSLPRRFTLCRVRDRVIVVVIVATRHGVRLTPASLDRFLGRVRGNQTVTARADQVLSARLNQGF